MGQSVQTKPIGKCLGQAESLANYRTKSSQVKLGTLLRSMAIEAGCLTDDEARVFDKVRDKTPAEPMQLDPQWLDIY